MSIELIVAFAVTLFALALVADRLGRVFRVPHTLPLVLVGFLLSRVLDAGFGMDMGLGEVSFHDLVFFVFLPVLVFDAAFHIRLRTLGQNLPAILFLALVGVGITGLVSAALIYLGIGHPEAFPWEAALITGALLAATDPVAVIDQLKAMGAPARLTILLEGESLFNDASAIVVFGIVLGYATRTADPGPAAALVGFAAVFFGGAATGVAVGLVGAAALRLFAGGVSHALIVLTAAYGSFLLAEGALGVSGVMAALLAGLVLARTVQREDAPIVGTEISFLLGVLAFAANGSVFLLVGMTLSPAMFTERWQAMLIAVGAVLVARALVVLAALPALNPLLSSPVPGPYRQVLAWGGLRGAVTLALALSLPTSLEYAWVVQAMAYGVVLFTLFVQAPLMPGLIRRAVG